MTLSRTPVSQADALQALVAKLRSDLGLSEPRCYFSLSPFVPPKIPRAGDYVIAVSPGASTFPEEEQHTAFCIEHQFVSTTIYTRVELDPVDKAEQLLLEATRGLYQVKRLVMKSLVGADLLHQGQPFLAQLLRLESAQEPNYDQQKRVAWLELVWRMTFHHDLTS